MRTRNKKNYNMKNCIYMGESAVIPNGTRIIELHL